MTRIAIPIASSTKLLASWSVVGFLMLYSVRKTCPMILWEASAIEFPVGVFGVILYHLMFCSSRKNWKSWLMNSGPLSVNILVGIRIMESDALQKKKNPNLIGALASAIRQRWVVHRGEKESKRRKEKNLQRSCDWIQYELRWVLIVSFRIKILFEDLYVCLSECWSHRCDVEVKENLWLRVYALRLGFTSVLSTTCSFHPPGSVFPTRKFFVLGIFWERAHSFDEKHLSSFSYSSSVVPRSL